MLELDARGFGCPIPVVKTKKALEDNPNQPVTVLLDAEVAVENVTRLGESRNYTVKIENLDSGDFRLMLTPR